MTVGASHPFVSVVVPVRNDARHIEGCVRQLLEQTYPRDRLEILVVDGMSDDGTRQAVEGVQAAQHGGSGQLAPAIRVLDNPGRQRPSAMNVGIRAARGEVIARVDARTVLPRDYLERCVRALRESGADNVGGVQRALASGTAQEAIGLAMSHPFGAGNAQFRLAKRSGYVDTVYLGCFKREVFDRVGMFDEESPLLSEDSDINQRIRESGGRVYLDAGTVVGYYPRERLGELWRLYFRYGGARAGNLLKHGNLTSWRQVVPAAFVATLVVLALLSVVSRWALAGLGAVLGLYLACDAAVAASVCLGSRKWALWPWLAAAFPCMHFAWAAGFFRRLCDRRAGRASWAWTER
ncbi:MAG TPA: glycosyltransferase family 2 protein [bacterium]|nr:glycosyltransferase family 2 protein [bacterium]